MNKNLILALDISTSCIGCSILTPNKEVKLLTHIVPKISNKIKGIEALFLKKEIFEKEFIEKYKNIGITEVVIEEPLLSSNNINTVATLLRFNGMLSEAIYRLMGIVPTYISSLDARKYSFPDLMGLRKFNKKGELYERKKILNDLKNNHLVLFSEYPWDVDKKQVMWNKVIEIYPDIEWLYDKKNSLKKENFDMCDALVCGLAYINKKENENFETNNFTIISHNISDNILYYVVKIWNKTYHKTIHLI